jgi:hypothetical protein
VAWRTARNGLDFHPSARPRKPNLRIGVETREDKICPLLQLRLATKSQNCEDGRNALGAVHLLNKKKPSTNPQPWIDIKPKSRTLHLNDRDEIDVQQNQ